VFRSSFFERTNGNLLLKKFNRYTLIFGGTTTKSVFLGYFPEQERYAVKFGTSMEISGLRI
jgi:hypothetical protein